MYFLKRTQLVSSDISQINVHFREKPLKNLQSLTAFADYKLPQILREYKILKYSDILSNKINHGKYLQAGSAEEIEIRAATIWTVELIRQYLKKYSSVQIDNALWLLSQNLKNPKPYHRTRTIFY